MASSRPSPALTRTIGGRLRVLREANGRTVQWAADRAGMSKSAWSRFELGEGWPGTVDLAQGLARVLRALGVDESQYHAVMTDVHKINTLGWFIVDLNSVDEQFALLLDYERIATSITDVVACTLPGIIQTRRYAEAVFTRGGVPAGRVAQRVEARLSRRRALDRDTMTLTAVIAESALHSPIAAADIMAEQLEEVVAVARQPNVIIRVLPTNAAMSLVDGGYLLLEFADDPPVAYADNVFGGMFLIDPTKVAHVVRQTRRLVAATLEPDQSIRLIRGALRKFRSRSKGA
ncbi:MAG TPA: helix-turn-helix transcriptional regulator [Pedococcus sp.]|nr:helix-turn-helix transcriptional regulator [Pedococcus sp.]